YGPLAFRSKQDGGYAELAYRPTKLDNDFLRNLEMIFRWDHLSRDPSGQGDPEEARWTLGLNYWLSPSTVLKAAYEWDQPNGEPNRNALLIQAAIDRKSTRLNSSHVKISYAVFCLKKKKK